MSGGTTRAKEDGVHRALGLTDDEYASIVSLLGREPTALELAMYAVMWSEHCSYKSSRLHLRRLPTRGPQVLVGPGENAGVVDVGGGVAVAMRIESHNHPSAVEPFQGAATGVGGILRDVFTMGARPIALMDALFMGPLDDARSRFILDGVVRGIASYGNAVGVPTVGGQLSFAPCYRDNPLVNVFCLGVLPVDRLVLARASGEGNLAVLLGARTGRDGIGGVSVLASAGFDEGDPGAGKRPSVQVGDPFEEKRLIEACLQLLDEGLVVALQDLGGAGLSCAASETAARGGVGMEVYLDAVARREQGMTPVEVMTSESQERMLAVVAPTKLGRVLEICRRWEVEASVVGEVVAPEPGGEGLLRVRERRGGPPLAEVPARSLSDGAPLYDRPKAPPADLEERRGDEPSEDEPAGDSSAELLALVEDVAVVYRQYDHELFCNTVLGPGDGDAVVLRLAAPGIRFDGRGLALSTDANPGWCAVDPRLGTAATLAESTLNVACAGARPVAVVNCLNFGNPEHPEVMWSLSEAVDGLAEACETLGVPVVGGNVSLYNESGGRDIEPTPVVTTLGVVDRLDRRPPALRAPRGSSLVLLGRTTPLLGGSRWARELRGRTNGRLAPLDLELHRRLLALVRNLVLEPGLVEAVHDVSGGGLAVCLAEIATRSAAGVVVTGIADHRELFSESPSRVVCASARPREVVARAEEAGVEARVIGVVGGERLVVEGLVDLAVDVVARAGRSRLEDALGAPSRR
jgi:phosphoribosylformylglycinamidine synthase II